MIARTKQFAAAVLLICTAVVPRVRAQDQKTAAPKPATYQAQSEIKLQAPPPQYQPPAETEPAPPAPHRQLNLAPNYSVARSWFPNVAGPYQGAPAPQPDLQNAPRIHQLIQNGQLMLSLPDAISLALENNLNIAVERYTPWMDEASLLYAQSGANGITRFDPTLESTLSLDQSDIPYNNPVQAGILTSLVTPIAYKNDTATEKFGYTQGFATGTVAQVTFDNARNSTNFGSFFAFNPAFTSTLTVELTQPLLQGFGKLPSTRYIIEARNTAKIGASQFKQEVMAIVTQVATDYWELVYSRQFVKIEQVTVAADRQLYQNNQAEARVGNMATIDVITAQSQLASDQQLLIQAQTSEMLENAALAAAITKNLLEAPLQKIEIVPTTPIYTPSPENLSLAEAIGEALRNRPELVQAELTLKNAGVEVRATKNALLPKLDLFAEYQGAGLSGVVHPNVPTGSFITTNPVFTTSGLVPAGAIPTGYVGAAVTAPGIPIHQGIVGAWNQMIHGAYPTFAAGLNVTLPIRNRAAQGQYAQAQLRERQSRVAYQQTQQSIILNVRQMLTTLQQDRAAVAAAKEARIYNQQSYNDELKELQLGSSTASSFTVIQKQALLTQAENVELLDRVHLIEAQLNLDLAMGRTLKVQHITIADAMSSSGSRPPEIPGTPDANQEN